MYGLPGRFEDSPRNSTGQVVVTGSVVLLVQQDQMTDELYKLIGGKDIVFGAPNMGTMEMAATEEGGHFD
jgi:hypothetical protein